MKEIKYQYFIIYGFIFFLLLFPFFAGGTYLNDLEDVTISGVTDNAVLVYDSASANWTNDNVTASIPSYLTSAYHPHNQDVNSTGNPTWLTVGIEDYIHHVGDVDTLIELLTDNIIFKAGNLNMLELIESTTDEIVINEDSVDMDFRVESNGNINMFHVNGGTESVGIGDINTATELLVYDADNNLDVTLKSDNTDGYCTIAFYNDAQAYHVRIRGPDDSFRIRDATGNKHCIVLEKGVNDYGLYFNAPGQLNIWSQTGTAGKELDLLGDAEFTSHVDSCSRLTKDIIFDLKELPDSKVLKLLRLIDFYVFRWKDPLLPMYDENNTLIGTQPWNTEGFGVGPVAEWLYDDILYNFTGNQELNQKVADAIVGRESTLWTVDKDAIFMLYARGWQINDERLSILEQEVFGS